MIARPSRTWRLVQLALTLVFVVFAAWYLWRQWSSAADARVRLRFDPAWLALASVIVLATYALLIETWRRVLAALGAPVAFAPAAVVWFVSNLGKYVPGKIWQLSAMTVMIGSHGVSVSAAGASAAVITIANIATGFAIVLLTSAATVRQLSGGIAAVVLVTVALLVALLATPLLARHWNQLARRLGREQLSVNIPLRAVWVAVGGCALSWLLYGLAFQYLVRSLIGDTRAPLMAYVTANTASYLLGYLAIFAPGGIGVREVALSAILVPLRIATAQQAVLITVASRLWLTVLEITPSLLALARAAGIRQSRGSRIP